MYIESITAWVPTFRTTQAAPLVSSSKYVPMTAPLESFSTSPPGGPGGPCKPSATGSSCVSPRLHASRTATRPVDVLQSTAALAAADVATQATITPIHLHAIHRLLAGPRGLRDFPVPLAWCPLSWTPHSGTHVPPYDAVSIRFGTLSQRHVASRADPHVGTLDGLPPLPRPPAPGSP